MRVEKVLSFGDGFHHEEKKKENKEKSSESFDDMLKKEQEKLNKVHERNMKILGGI